MSGTNGTVVIITSFVAKSRACLMEDDGPLLEAMAAGR